MAKRLCSPLHTKSACVHACARVCTGGREENYMIRKHLDTLPVLGCANVSTHSTFSARSPTTAQNCQQNHEPVQGAHPHVRCAVPARSLGCEGRLCAQRCVPCSAARHTTPSALVLAAVGRMSTRQSQKGGPGHCTRTCDLAHDLAHGVIVVVGGQPECYILVTCLCKEMAGASCLTHAARYPTPCWWDPIRQRYVSQCRRSAVTTVS